MIQAVCESCSVRWTKVNRKVYKFQSLVFSEEGHEHETSQSSSDRVCPIHSKITAPTQWKQVYGEYLGRDNTEPQSMLGSTLPIEPSNDCPDNTDDVTSGKRELRRVRFEVDHEETTNQDDTQTQKIGCLPDCYLCRSINHRTMSPPYQALQEQRVVKPAL